MRERLIVSTDSAGVPKAEVPFSCMWDLVEYLSIQRMAVSYHYQATHFEVTFPRVDKMTAQQILDHWATSQSQVLQTA